jgi:hypothetical protein
MSDRHYHRPHEMTRQFMEGGHMMRAWLCECGLPLEPRRARDTDPKPFPDKKEPS